jgi:sporulation protein YlmC with PRC-barrel domain
MRKHRRNAEDRAMRLELGKAVMCEGQNAGELADLVVDPVAKRVTHLVVKREQGAIHSQLVPIEVADPGAPDGAVRLTCSAKELAAFPHVEEFVYLRTERLPQDDPDWDVGVQDVLAFPYYDATGLATVDGDVGVTYDRVPKGEVEVRRTSQVIAADGHYIGDVDGFLVDETQNITHFVLERGHLWGRREVTVPIGAVENVASDEVKLSLSRDEVGALPSHRVHRWL